MDVAMIDCRAANAGSALSESLRQTGFVVLTDHSISFDLINECYSSWREFFASDEKFSYLYQKPKQEGYFPFQTEKAKDSEVSDLKEFFQYYPCGALPKNLRQVTTHLYSVLNEMAKQVLTWIEGCLPLHILSSLSESLSSMVEGSQQTMLRILHYPPLEAPHTQAVRASAHEDINLITLLPAATSPGLEVLSSDGKWQRIDCDPGHLVINAGDMLQMCTSHYYKSTTHRVVNPNAENTSRYSMPLFLHPRPEVLLAPSYTANQYLIRRLQEIGIY